MKEIFCFAVLSGLVNAIVPEGNGKHGMRLILGLIAIGMIADACLSVFTEIF